LPGAAASSANYDAAWFPDCRRRLLRLVGEFSGQDASLGRKQRFNNKKEKVQHATNRKRSVEEGATTDGVTKIAKQYDVDKVVGYGARFAHGEQTKRHLNQIQAPDLGKPPKHLKMTRGHYGFKLPKWPLAPLGDDETKEHYEGAAARGGSECKKIVKELGESTGSYSSDWNVNALTVAPWYATVRQSSMVEKYKHDLINARLDEIMRDADKLNFGTTLLLPVIVELVTNEVESHYKTS